LATPTKATFRTPSAHHGKSEQWKPRPFPCCVVNPLACLEQSTAGVTSNHGARANRSPSVQPNAFSVLLIKFFELGTPESESPQKRRLANLRLTSRPPFTTTASWYPSLCLYTAVGSHICRPAKNSWQVACPHPLRLGAHHGLTVSRSITTPRFASEPQGRLGSHICRPVKK